MKYRADIDGLRAFAVLSVVSFHAFPALFKGGFIGVDIFFVISGYLITRIIFNELDNGTFNFLYFFGKRVRRLFPALILVMTFAVGFGWFALLADEYAQLGKHVASSATFILNFVLVNEVSYFDNAAATKPMLHLWSLAVEEQFYLLWPLVLWLAWRLKFNLLMLTTAVAFLSFLLSIMFVNTNPVETFYWPAGRFWELLSGSVLAWFFLYKHNVMFKVKLRLDRYLVRGLFSFKRVSNGRTVENLISFMGLLVLSVGVSQMDEELGFPGLWAMVPVLGALLVIAAGPKAWFNRVLLTNKISVWFGLISYPLYLWHWPILSFARIIEKESPNRTIIIFAVLLSIFLAWITYRFIEYYIRRAAFLTLKNIVLLSTMFSLGCFGYWIHLSNGIEDRAANSKISEISLLLKKPELVKGYYKCEIYLPALDVSEFDEGHCKIFQPNTPDVLFIGDSHLAHFESSLMANKSIQNIATVQGNSCLPFSSSNYFDRASCRLKFNALLDFLQKDKTIRIVVLSAFWNKAMTSGVGSTGENWRLAAEPTSEKIDSFKANAKLFLDSALTGGRKVVFMKDVPQLGFNIYKCFSFRPIQLTKSKNIISNCFVTVEDLTRRNYSFNVVLSELLDSYNDILVFDPVEHLCSEGVCDVVKDGFPLYFNGDHVNYLGANKVIIPFLKSGLIETSSLK